MPPPSRRLRLLIVGAVVAAVACWFAVGRWQAVTAGLETVTDLDRRFVAGGAVLSLVAIWNRGLMYREAHFAAGLDCRVREMTATAAVAFGAQKLVRSAGASGLAVFVHRGRRHGRSASGVTASCAVVAAASLVALGGVMAATIAVLASLGRLTGWWLLAGAGFALYAGVTAAVAWLLTKHRGLLHRSWMSARRVVARLRRRPRPAPDTQAIDAFFDAVAVVRTRPRAVRRVIASALVGKALGAAMLLVAARAADVAISPAQALVVYATVLGASFVSVLPGGVGTVEASAVAVLVAGGAGTGAATLAVALFRVFDVWLPVVAGLMAARSGGGEQTSDEAGPAGEPPMVVMPAPSVPSSTSAVPVAA